MLKNFGLFAADSKFETIENKKRYFIYDCSMGNIKTGISLMQT